MMFASGLDCVDYQLEQVIDDKYMRIQSQLKVVSAEMDDITPQNIKCLQQEAKAMIESHQRVIDVLSK